MRRYNTRVTLPAVVTAGLADLLSDEALELSLVAGPADARYAAVRWPGRPGDRPWLAAGDLRIVVVDEASAGPDLERALRPPPAVLVCALTPTVRTLPPRLAARGLPPGSALVTAPPAVRPELVEVAALRGLVAATAGAGAALAAPQSHLLAGLEGPKPERDLLERLHDLTGADLVLLSPWGEVVARAGAGAWRPGADAPGTPGTPPVTSWGEGEVRLGGRTALLLRLELAGRPRGVLLAFEVAPTARPWLELTRTLLVAAAEVRAARARAEAAGGSALLTALLAAPGSATRLAPALRRAGFEPGAPYRVGVLEVSHGPGQHGAVPGRAWPAPTGPVREALEELFGQRGLPVLTDVAVGGAAAGTITWLAGAAGAAPGGGPTELGAAVVAAARAALGSAGNDDPSARRADAAPGPTLRLGLSRVQAEPGAAALAERQARLALAGAPPGEAVALFDELDPVAWFVERPEADLALARERVLGPLLAADHHGKLLATLTAYLEGPADPAALAARLGVHANTLRNRLKRIEELVGSPLARPETLARLWLVTRAVPTVDPGGARQA